VLSEQRAWLSSEFRCSRTHMCTFSVKHLYSWKYLLDRLPRYSPSQYTETLNHHCLRHLIAPGRTLLGCLSIVAAPTLVSRSTGLSKTNVPLCSCCPRVCPFLGCIPCCHYQIKRLSLIPPASAVRGTHSSKPKAAPKTTASMA
jgi:hypothetical protein